MHATKSCGAYHRFYIAHVHVHFLRLKHHLMRVLALCKSKRGFQVLGQVRLLLNSRNDSLVNILLVSRFGFRKRLFWLGFALFEKFCLCRSCTLRHSLGKICVVDLGVNLPPDNQITVWCVVTRHPPRSLQGQPSSKW